jgi:hypothetical protein
MTEKEMTEALMSMVGGLAGVKVKVMVRGTRSNYTVGGKIFAFTRKDGVVLKLSAERVKELEETRGAAALVMGKRTMKEWVVVPYADAKALRKDLKLVKEAMKSAEMKR